MMSIRSIGGLFAAVLFVMNVVGCAGSKVDVAPPCASIAVPSASDPQVWFKGQGIMAEGRILTAAHIFTGEGGEFPPQSVFVDRRLTWIMSSDSGSVDVVRRVYDSGVLHTPNDLLQDWVVFDTGDRSAGSRSSWFIGPGEALPGEVLTALRWNDHTQVMECARLRVIEVASSDPISSAVTFVENADRVPLGSWSGCFVGRFDAPSGKWEFLGMLVAGSIAKDERGSKDVEIVIRPPEHVLEWLVAS